MRKNLNDGDKVKVKIKYIDTPIDAVIARFDDKGNEFFLLSNDSGLNGKEAPDRRGFNYSWVIKDYEDRGNIPWIEKEMEDDYEVY